MIVDEMHEEHPELLKDQYWNEVVPTDLPYTMASVNYRREEPAGSAEHYKVKDSEALYANLFTGPHVHRPGNKSGQCEDVYADYVSAVYIHIIHTSTLFDSDSFTVITIGVHNVHNLELFGYLNEC